jgi:hypothetical protein
MRQPQGCPLPVAVTLRVPVPPQDRYLAVPVRLPSDYINAGRVVVNGRTTITLRVHPESPARFGNFEGDALTAEFDRSFSSPWRPIGNFYQSDLGAAANRLACAPSANT